MTLATIYGKQSKKVKDISQYESIPNTNNVDWDDTSNGMNDVYVSVTTAADVWVWLFNDENYDLSDSSIVVPPGSINYNLKDNDFSGKVGSFKVCNYDPLVGSGQ